MLPSLNPLEGDGTDFVRTAELAQVLRDRWHLDTSRIGRLLFQHSNYQHLENDSPTIPTNSTTVWANNVEMAAAGMDMGVAIGRTMTHEFGHWALQNWPTPTDTGSARNRNYGSGSSWNLYERPSGALSGSNSTSAREMQGSAKWRRWRRRCRWDWWSWWGRRLDKCAGVD